MTYNADVALLLSEIDPAQNNAVNAAVTHVGFKETAIYAMNLKAGPVVSLNLYNPGSGYGAAPTVTHRCAALRLPTRRRPALRATATADIDTDNTSATFGQVTGLTLVSRRAMATPQTLRFSIAGTAQAQASLALEPAWVACSNERRPAIRRR